MFPALQCDRYKTGQQEEQNIYSLLSAYGQNWLKRVSLELTLLKKISPIHVACLIKLKVLMSTVILREIETAVNHFLHL